MKRSSYYSVKCLDEVGIDALACARKSSLRLRPSVNDKWLVGLHPSLVMART